MNEWKEDFNNVCEAEGAYRTHEYHTLKNRIQVF